MEKLQYVIEDKTIARLLGEENFTTEESAVLELVKNAYDARAPFVNIIFEDNTLTIQDGGDGMNEDDIKQLWMHVGKSTKDYSISLDNGQEIVLAGSKGIGRFALAKLGEKATVISKKIGFPCVVWETDWNSSSISNQEILDKKGTKILISRLRTKWNKTKVESLILFLSKTYNDNIMKIKISHPEFEKDKEIVPYITELRPGINCLTKINLKYNSYMCSLAIEITSDEFKEEAAQYCSGINLKYDSQQVDIFDELEKNNKWDLSPDELKQKLILLGDFYAEFAFTISGKSVEADKFLYKHSTLQSTPLAGVILYRNAFSISSYEGKKDWLNFGKRSRMSPAAATHPTGAWRVRENQIAGKVVIDKRRNKVLQDLSNRQGLDENIFYEIFVEINNIGIKCFERYRQNIIRHIDKKNAPQKKKTSPVSDKITSNPNLVTKLTKEDARQLADEIKEFQQANIEAQRERENVETRYKYDIRILNVLATVGLKASSIAHEMRNDRNSIANNIDYIIDALKKYNMWDELNASEKRDKSYYDVPGLLDSNKSINTKILTFMNTMLGEIEKKQFQPSNRIIIEILKKIKKSWTDDYACVEISIDIKEDISFIISEDCLQVIFDNLILNSIQQNENLNQINISISAYISGGMLYFSYSDNGKGLDKKYLDKPEKILEVHETTRNNGHGLGMWIVNNTINMTDGEITKINGTNGFSIEFTLGEMK